MKPYVRQFRGQCQKCRKRRQLTGGLCAGCTADAAAAAVAPVKITLHDIVPEKLMGIIDWCLYRMMMHYDEADEQSPNPRYTNVEITAAYMIWLDMTDRERAMEIRAMLPMIEAAEKEEAGQL